jgi:hypothetical protein
VATLSALITGFDEPPAPKQPDGPPATIVDAVDGRPTDAIWKDNRLAVVSTSRATRRRHAEDRDCVRVSELNTSTPRRRRSSRPSSSARTAPTSTWAASATPQRRPPRRLHASPTIAGQYASSYSAYQTRSAANNSLSARGLLSAGAGNYPGTRWGDYVGVAQDPQVPNAVWQANQFSAGADFWATEVSQLQTGGSSYVPIVPVRVLDTRFGTGPVGRVQRQRPAQLPGRGRPRDPGPGRRRHRQCDGRRPDVGRLPLGHPDAGHQPPELHDQLPARRHPGEQRHDAPRGQWQAVGRLQGRGRPLDQLIVDITGYFLAGSDDSTYATITPVRVLDNRPGIGIGLTGPFNTNAPRTLSIANANGIPADAKAVTANVTIVGQTKAGYLSITPDPDPNPTTSILNFPLGDTRANGASLPLNDQGDLSIVYKASQAGTTNVLLDITGYYREDPSGLQFFPLTPGRILDSRPGVPLSGLTGTFKAKTPRQLPVSGHWGVPGSAQAVTGNLTVVGQTAAGYVSATLASNPAPTTSVLNFPLGDVRANGVTLPLNGAGKEWLVYVAGTGKATNLILDVSGYFN